MKTFQEFQSTRPRGARLNNTRILYSIYYCFNPRAREGRDFFLGLAEGFIPIVSIHAPARGATDAFEFDGADAEGFQSTRPRGARPRRRYGGAPPRPRFNPRAREGRDFVDARELDVRDVVSIHAPARGATAAHDRVEVVFRVSIHAPARGATQADDSIDRTYQQFQSTRPRGARLSPVGGHMIEQGFNPRAREGRDLR